ncbi:10516_t:CDS:2 [Ambispora gerdemannii]|uniref:10516_t:CDS:1 n=1 Tax=Ambispora gerdemannii TaxID=144530 RepID=A0A9N8YPK7_9GLOM|nr:10516_t:CDS:2 [Ambispora gerdemannii]
MNSLIRHRTTPSQVQYLEQFFEHDDFPDGPTRERIAQTLKMPSKSVHIWFQNRRAKRKQEERTRQERLTYGFIESGSSNLNRTDLESFSSKDDSSEHSCASFHRSFFSKYRENTMAESTISTFDNKAKDERVRLPPIDHIIPKGLLDAPTAVANRNSGTMKPEYSKNSSKPLQSVHHQSTFINPFLSDKDRNNDSTTAIIKPIPRSSPLTESTLTAINANSNHHHPHISLSPLSNILSSNSEKTIVGDSEDGNGIKKEAQKRNKNMDIASLLC